jgi:hypothetical protein
MYNELEKIKEKVVMAYFKALPWNLLRMTEKLTTAGATFSFQTMYLLNTSHNITASPVCMV